MSNLTFISDLDSSLFAVSRFIPGERKRTRLKGYDYSSVGAYFITICSYNKGCIFSNIVGGGALDAPQNKLSNIGKIVEKHILSTNNILGITVDKYVIMPNHIHLILISL